MFRIKWSEPSEKQKQLTFLFGLRERFEDLYLKFYSMLLIINWNFYLFSISSRKEYMLQIPGLKIIRVYNNRKEQAEFPVPNKPAPLKYPTDEDDHNFNEDAELKAVSLHHIIRSDQCPFALELREYESKFKAHKEEGLRTSDKEVDDYREVRFLKTFF